jgi:small subunit ribosomal protein S8e
MDPYLIRFPPPIPGYYPTAHVGKNLNIPTLTKTVKLSAYYKGGDLKKPSGGKKGRVRKTKKKALCGGPPQIPKLGEADIRVVERVRGGNLKVRLREARYANVYLPKERRSVKAKIMSIISTPANPDLARRNYIVKGAIIQTEVGKAVVTSRPGQDGVVNAVLIE